MAVKIEAKWPKGLVVDPHTRKPFAMAWFCVTPQNDIVFFEEWPREDFYQCRTSLAIPQYADLIKGIEKTFPGGANSVTWRIMDPNYGRTRSPATGNTVEEEFDLYDLHFDTTVDDDIEAGHLAIRKRLAYDAKQPISSTNRPTLYIREGLKNLTKAMLNYQWVEPYRKAEKDAREKPKERWKDFADLIRYTCVFDPTYFDPKEEMLYHEEWKQTVQKGTKIFQ